MGEARAGEILTSDVGVLASAGGEVLATVEVIGVIGQVLAAAGEVLATAAAERPVGTGASVGAISHVRGSRPTTRTDHV